MKRKKRTTDVPSKLENLIKRIGEIPFNKNFPKVEEVGGEFTLNSIEDLDSTDSRILRERMIESLENLPINFLEYIWGKGLIPEVSVDEELESPDVDLSLLYKQTEEAALRYIELKKQWHQFRLLTELVDGFFTIEKPPKTFRNPVKINRRGIQSWLRMFPIEIEADIDFRSDGKVFIKLDEFSKAIDEVDITRIRSCKWCHRIFWAGRKDQVCCPPTNEGEKYSACKNLYNVNKLNEKKKIETRRKVLEELRENYKDKEVWACDATFKFSRSRANLPKTMKLNLVPLRIIDVLCNDDLETVYKFLALDKSSKREGYIEFSYNSRLRDSIKRVFSFK